MAYVLDANVFIQAKNLHYGLDFCPAFWEWLIAQNAGRLTYYGNTPRVAVLRRPSFYQRWETARDAGMLLYGVQHGRLGRIRLT